MPLIFAENEITESGVNYADRTGIQYQYPKRLYKNIIKPGERFIYYRGRRTFQSSRSPQVYFGTGVVGDVHDDPADRARLLCDIVDYQLFKEPVPFKFGDDDYLESGGKRKGYFQRGVRRISERNFQRVLTLAELPATQTESHRRGTGQTGHFYADPETARLVDEYAIQAAQCYLAAEYPDGQIEVMARNNPGFDILVTQENRVHYVEVKGTQRSVPKFFMSDGELRFSKENSGNYQLLVFYQIDLEEKNHKTFSWVGMITNAEFHLAPTQWSIAPKT